MVSKIYHDEEERFCLAQIFFTISISFSWLLNDAFRLALGLSALLICSKEQRRMDVIRLWCGFTKFSGLLLMCLAVWIICIPLFGGVESLPERIRGTARPLEVVSFCVCVTIFAKNYFFEEMLYKCSLVSIVVFSIFVFCKRVMVDFSAVRGGWLFDMRADIVANLLCMLMPWLLYALFDKQIKHSLKIMLCMVTLLTIAMVWVTYIRIFWLGLIVQLISAFILLVCCLNIDIRKHIYKLCLIMAILLIGIAISYHCVQEVRLNFAQSLSSSSFSTFSSRRDVVWKEALSIINNRKLWGYGWTDYDVFTTVFKAPHPHSSYLHAAFCTGIIGGILYASVLFSFLFLSVCNLIKRRGPVIISFVVALVIIVNLVVGLTESFFYIGREYLIPFWSTLVLLISPLYVRNDQ